MTTYDHAHQRSLFLSAQQQELLTAVVDRIIPAADGVPGAGELEVAEHVEGISGVTTQARSLLVSGLKAIEATSGRIHSKGFSDLSDFEKTDVLQEVETLHENFFNALIQETYSGYYSHPVVLRAKDLPLSAPQPVGYEVEPFDMSLLEPVRKRGKAYRDT